MFPEHVLRADEVRKRVLLPLISAFNRSLPNLASCGFPMIVDYVMESRTWPEEWVRYLDGHRVYFVGVKCPLEELERREQVRGNRQIGFARWQFERVHRYGSYDLEIDTHASTPQECAAQLKELLLSNPEPEAFPRLARS